MVESVRPFANQCSTVSLNKKPLKDLTDALLEKETLDEKEVAEILKNAKLPKEVKLHD